MKKRAKRRGLSSFAAHILFCSIVIITVSCIGYIATVDHMSASYRAGCLFYALLLAEAIAFTCFADYIHKTM
ncbi:MAG: hypothetical protein CVU97_00390 [Firmicutes bacterium HGW-Firmicutes-21]|nr:MAG: hypothetical protein CVU97_00390 [Firmicutes bacterium HGW-Firmicutes-21]